MSALLTITTHITDDPAGMLNVTASALRDHSRRMHALADDYDRQLAELPEKQRIEREGLESHARGHRRTADEYSAAAARYELRARSYGAPIPSAGPTVAGTPDLLPPAEGAPAPETGAGELLCTCGTQSDEPGYPHAINCRLVLPAGMIGLGGYVGLGLIKPPKGEMTGDMAQFGDPKAVHAATGISTRHICECGFEGAWDEMRAHVEVTHTAGLLSGSEAGAGETWSVEAGRPGFGHASGHLYEAEARACFNSNLSADGYALLWRGDLLVEQHNPELRTMYGPSMASDLVDLGTPARTSLPDLQTADESRTSTRPAFMEPAE